MYSVRKAGRFTCILPFIPAKCRQTHQELVLVQYLVETEPNQLLGYSQLNCSPNQFRELVSPSLRYVTSELTHDSLPQDEVEDVLARVLPFGFVSFRHGLHSLNSI